MAARVMHTLSVGLNPLAVCDEEGCRFHSPESPQTRDLAKEHVKATGHRVLVETVTRDVYRAVER